MFTVKHRESDMLGGNEYLYSAQTIAVVRKGDHFSDGIFLDPEPPEPVAPLAPGEPKPEREPVRMAKTCILFGGTATQGAFDRQGGHVWIMNEAGATVASYEL